MSIIPSQLSLLANLHEIEQNQTVTLSALVKDQYGNPIADQDIELYIDHHDYGMQVLLTHEVTDVKGSVIFEVPLRSVGNSKLLVQSGSLSSSSVTVRVLPATDPSLGPKTWPGVAHSLTRLQVDLNTLIGQLLTKSHNPTKKELCSHLGLDYDKANDRNRISQALYALKMWFDYLWRALYQQSISYSNDFSSLMNDNTGFSAWSVDPNSPYAFLKTYYHQSDDEIRELWVLSRMWDFFVQKANQYNLHLFVAYQDGSGVWRYKQPSFWEYVEKQIWSASRLGRAMGKILARHRDLGMILTSGESIHRALEQAQNINKMITDRTVPRIRCIKCWRTGSILDVSSQDELADHIKAMH